LRWVPKAWPEHILARVLHQKSCPQLHGTQTLGADS
jgi:hypothetical protein